MLNVKCWNKSVLINQCKSCPKVVIYKDKSSFQELCYGIWAQIEFKYQGLTETLDHVLHQMFEMIPLQHLDHKILKCQLRGLFISETSAMSFQICFIKFWVSQFRRYILGYHKVCTWFETCESGACHVPLKSAMWVHQSYQLRNLIKVELRIFSYATHQKAVSPIMVCCWHWKIYVQLIKDDMGWNP